MGADHCGAARGISLAKLLAKNPHLYPPPVYKGRRRRRLRGISGALMAAVLLWGTLLTSAGHAAVDFHANLPLSGYYRPGRYMPVQWNGRGTIPPFTLHADAAVATIIGAPDPAGLAPFLPIGSIDAVSLHSTDGSIDARLPLHELTPADILIASADDRVALDDVARSLAPGKTATALHLDSANPLPGPAVAYTTIDFLVLTTEQVGNLSDDAVGTLLAGGTVLVVAADAPPNGLWPWRADGRFYVLAGPPPLSPQSAAGANALYSSWRPGLTEFTRRQAWLMGLAAGLLVVGISLWRSRRMLPAFGVAVVFAVAGISAWQNAQPLVACANADVVLRTPRIERTDRWIIQQCDRPADSIILFDGFTIPAVENPRQAGDVSVICQSTGKPLALRWQFADGPRPPEITIIGHARARAAAAAPTAATDSPVESPLSPLAASIYHGPIIGAAPMESNSRAVPANAYRIFWPGIVIDGAER